jgi:SHS2 domain-containing protein
VDERRASSGHRAVEHTADLAVELWAPDEPGLLEEGRKALVELLTEGALDETGAQTSAGTAATRDVALDALDPEDRLVRYLNEILFFATVEGFVTTGEALTLRPPGHLEGRLTGRADARALLRTEIKAVTYHDLHITRVDGELRARLVLDV